MKADPSAQRRLLDLQSLDTAVDQLHYRRARLPELAELAERQQAMDEVLAEKARADAAVGKLDTSIRALEREVEQIREHAARDRKRLDSGKGAAKELERLQHEIESLHTRQSELEDRELELMEKREEAGVGLAQVEERVAQEQAAVTDASQRRDALFSEIDAAIADRDSERATLTSALPLDLVTLYEKVRAANSGVGAALLRARRCEGCRLDLSGTALTAARTAADDEVVRCEECGRILIRTPESGL